MEPISILKAIKHCLPKKSGSPIPLHHPSFCGKEWEYDKKCLDTGWVSSVGKYVDEHEDPLQATTGAKFAIAVVNETATSHLCLHLCGVEKDPDLLGHLMKEDHPTAAFPICEYWLDIGQPDNLKQAHGDFKDVFE